MKFGVVLVGGLTGALPLSPGAVSSAESSPTSAQATASQATTSNVASSAAAGSFNTTTLQSPTIPGVSPLPGRSPSPRNRATTWGSWQ